MICGCFLTLREGIPCKFVQRRKCVVKLHNPTGDTMSFFEFIVQLQDGQHAMMSGGETYAFLSGLLKNRARGHNLGHGYITAKMREAKIHLAHLEHLNTSYKQNEQPQHEALQWWRQTLMNVHLIGRVANATQELMTAYYDEHLRIMYCCGAQEGRRVCTLAPEQKQITWSHFVSSFNSATSTTAEMTTLREQNARLRTQLAQLQEQNANKEKLQDGLLEISYKKYEKLRCEHDILVQQEQKRKDVASRLNEQLLMVRECYQRYVNVQEVQKEMIVCAQPHSGPAIFLKNLLKAYNLAHTLESLIREYRNAYDSIQKLISPEPFICHMCENDSALSRTNTPTQAICKQININGICMLCYYYRRYRTLPEPNYTVTQQKMPNIVVMALFDGLRGVYTCEEKVFEDLNRRLLQQISTMAICILDIQLSILNSIGLMSNCASIDKTCLKSCYEAELKLLAEDVKEEDKKDACCLCCRERFDDDPDTLLKHSPFVMPCDKCPMLKCCIECFSNLDVKRVTRNDTKVMEQLNADRNTRYMGSLSYANPKTVSPCLNTPENCSVARNWMNYFGLLGGVNIVEVQYGSIDLETVYDELGNIVFQGPIHPPGYRQLEISDSDDE